MASVGWLYTSEQGASHGPPLRSRLPVSPGESPVSASGAQVSACPRSPVYPERQSSSLGPLPRDGCVPCLRRHGVTLGRSRTSSWTSSLLGSPVPTLATRSEDLSGFICPEK